MTALNHARPLKRQLRLPGVDLATDHGKRARRDFNAAEFERALARNGFLAVNGGLAFIDQTGRSDKIWSAVHRKDPIRVARRATLAKLIRARERDATERV